MPEPVSVAASVVALVNGAYKLCLSIYQTIDNINNAPNHLWSISQDLKAFSSVLGTIELYLNDQETFPNFLHPATSANLNAVLLNCLTILQDLSIIINGYLTNSKNKDITWWNTLRSTWKEKEVGKLRADLADHKRTLNIAIAAANLIDTSTTSAATQRIEEDVRELKANLATLLLRLGDRYQERGVVLDNYGATIRRFAREVDSITITSTFPEHPSSPSAEISLLEPSLGNRSTRNTAQSHRTVEMHSVTSRSTYQSFLSAETEIALSNDRTSEIDLTKTVQPSLYLLSLGQCQQLFVKDLTKHTIVLSSIEIPELVAELKEQISFRTGVPKDTFTLVSNSVILRDGSLSSYNIQHNSTLQARVHHFKDKEWLDHLEEADKRLLRGNHILDTTSFWTRDTASLGYYQRREHARQKFYTSYLRAKGALRLGTT